MKVLLVEDDVLIRKLTLRLLRSMFDNIEPWAADSVEQALDFLRESMLDRQFDLIVCDYDLVGWLKGDEVLAWVQTHASHLVRRFMFFSGNDAVKNRGVPAVEKPCEMALLRKTIEALVQGEAWPLGVSP